MGIKKRAKCPYSDCDYNAHGECNYFQMTGCVLPCRHGKHCHFAPTAEATERKRKPYTKLDTEKALEAYRQGENDAEIAQLCGVSMSAVYGWRKRINLTANDIRGGDRHTTRRKELHNDLC